MRIIGQEMGWKVARQAGVILDGPLGEASRRRTHWSRALRSPAQAQDCHLWLAQSHLTICRAARGALQGQSCGEAWQSLPQQVRA